MFTVIRRLTSQQIRLASCWSCSTVAQDVICAKCGKVQPVVKDINYFRVLDQQEKFTLNAEELQNKFRNLQRLLHPDKYANSSQQEKTYSADQSALVNQAYQTLLKPIKRALYLLEIKGVQFDEVKLPQEFLLEMMDLNEQIDEADDSKKDKLRKDIDKLEEQQMAILQDHFAEKRTEEASATLAKIKYLENVKNRLN